MAKKTVLIYDDEKRNAEKYAKKLRAIPSFARTFSVKPIPDPEFRNALKKLTDKQIAFRKGENASTDDTLFDEADVLVVDYDLLQRDAMLTGEGVAYQVRCFSNCKVIVGLNQFGTNVFDLTLKGHPDSYADINIGGNQLANPGLWSKEKDLFRPWCWPQLSYYSEAFDNKCTDVLANINRSVCETIGIPQEIAQFLPRSVSDFLGEDPATATWKEFVLKSGNGLRSKDCPAHPISDKMIARIGAARLSKWLERLVLPGQDILVDAPHLVSRFPSLLTGNTEQISSWQKTASIGPSFKSIGLRWKQIDDFRFKESHWLSRPAWYWPLLCGNENITEVNDPWSTERPDWVFCEDTSTFEPRAQCRECVIESDSPFARRYLRGKIRGVTYSPKVRFAL